MISPGKCTSTSDDCHAAVNGDAKVAERPRRVRALARSARTSTFACLVVSSDPLRQMMFGRTAERTGWHPLVCADSAVAFEYLETGDVGAALVDIAAPAERIVQDLRVLVERLAANKEVLTVVCGRTNDRLAEIWARELGVWAHLPGVAPESDLDSLLRAARHVVERMQGLREAANDHALHAST
jgi:hypothetical protein